MIQISFFFLISFPCFPGSIALLGFLRLMLGFIRGLSICRRMNSTIRYGDLEENGSLRDEFPDPFLKLFRTASGCRADRPDRLETEAGRREKSPLAFGAGA